MASITATGARRYPAQPVRQSFEKESSMITVRSAMRKRPEELLFPVEQNARVDLVRKDP